MMMKLTAFDSVLANTILLGATYMYRKGSCSSRRVFRALKNSTETIEKRSNMTTLMTPEFTTNPSFSKCITEDYLLVDGTVTWNRKARGKFCSNAAIFLSSEGENFFPRV